MGVDTLYQQNLKKIKKFKIALDRIKIKYYNKINKIYETIKR